MTALSAANARNSASALPGLLTSGSSSPAISSSNGTDALTSFSQMLRDSSQTTPMANPMPTPGPASASNSSAPKPASAPAPKASQDSPVSSADGKTQAQREDARLNAKRNAGAPTPAAQRGSTQMPAETSATAVGANADASADAATTAADGVAEEAVPTQDDANDDEDCQATLGVFSITVSTTTLTTAPDDSPAAANLAAALANAGAITQQDAGQAETAELGTGPGRAVRAAASTSTGARATALQLGAHERQAADASATADALDSAARTPGVFTIDAAADKGSSFASALNEAGKGLAANNSEARGGTGLEAGLLAGGAAALSEAHALKGGTSKTETVTSITLPQPITDTSFAPAMAARLSLLAADGVTEAKLHLNPAEMGPVAVQIVVDGQQAKISFHAEQAETRNVLERSLPDLAAALRDSGLTLSGGGVFQQARDPGQNASGREGSGADTRSGASRSGVTAVDAQDTAISSAKRLSGRSRGVVDLYA
jgi:flagellar hook-length control protein FliK